MATIKDVAQRAGVSVSTVSRVINRSGYVGEETERKVLRAMQELNFEPNPIARGLVSRKTATVGLLIPDVANPFFAELARGVEDAAIARGFSVLLCNSDWQPEREQMYIGLLRGRWVDGIIAVGSRSPAEQLLESVGDTPFVVVDRRPSELDHAVWMDNREGAVLATNHLFDIGCRYIVHVSGPPDSPSAMERRRGYEDAMARMGKEPCIVEGDFRFASGYQIGLHLFSQDHLPDGIFAANDLMAIGIIQAAVKLQARVPDQVAVVGYDNIAPASYVEPTLTTVEQPAYEMGSAAFELLHRQLQGEDEGTRQVQFEPRLVIRRSTQRGAPS